MLQLFTFNSVLFNSSGTTIAPIVQVLVSLRVYAHGTFELAAGDFAGISQSSVSRILHRFSAALAAHSSEYIKMPETDDERMQACRAFFLLKRFPRTIGAIDCTHVKIQVYTFVCVNIVIIFN